MKRSMVWLLIGLLILAGMGRAAAQGGAEVSWWVVAGGGGYSTGGGVSLSDTLGQAVVDVGEVDTVWLSAGYWYPGFYPTAAFLLSLEAVPRGAAILLTWETAQTGDTLGFYLYRAESPAGPLARVNGALIPSAEPPGSPAGAQYEWLDEEGLVPGRSYCYWLEKVDLYGGTALYGPVQVTAGGWRALFLPSIGR